LKKNGVVQHLKKKKRAVFFKKNKRGTNKKREITRNF